MPRNKPVRVAEWTGQSLNWPVMRSLVYALGAVIAFYLTLASGTPAIAHDADRPSGVDAVIELEIARDGDVPVITVDVFGRKLRFIADTCTPTTVFDEKWRAEVGANLRIDATASIDTNGTQIAFYEAPALRLGPFQPAIEVIRIADFGEYAASVGQPLDGCLGWDVLRKFITTWDCDRGVLQFRLSLPAEPGEAIHLSEDDESRPTVPFGLRGNGSAPFVICTGGSAAVLVCPTLYAELRDKGVLKSTNPTITATELRNTKCSAIARHVTIGPFTQEDVAIETAATDGLGMGYLSKYIVTLDPRRRRAYFKPGKNYARADSLDRSGVTFKKHDGDVMVGDVAPRSPAGESGMLVGDVLLSVNDEPVSTMSLFQLRQLMRSEKKAVAIRIDRDGTSLGVPLNLRNYQDFDAESHRWMGPGIPNRTRARASHVVAEFDVGRDGEPLIVPLTIDGWKHPFKMCVDTGSPCTTLNCEDWIAARLGKRIGSKTLLRPDGEATTHPQIRVGATALGGVPLSRASIVLSEDYMVEAFRILYGYDELDGILGMDLLRGQIVQVDFDAGKLRLLSEIGTDCGEKLDLVFKPSGVPTLQATIGGLEPQWFIADTGCVDRNFCDDDILSALQAKGAVSDLRAARPFQIPIAQTRKTWRVDQLDVGPFSHHQIGFASAQATTLGLPYLSRYTATFDFPNRAVYLRKGIRFGRAEFRDMSGLQIMRLQEHYVVVDVAPGSPAKKTGMAAGDVVLLVNGIDAVKFPLFKVRELLSDAGKAVVLSFLRDGETMERKFLLQDYSASRSEQHENIHRSDAKPLLKLR